MKLSLEIPHKHLEEFSPLTDYDFPLAQFILEDKDYREFYIDQRKQGRYSILDNGFHEQGFPLSPIELVQAADMIKPSVLVAPDWLGQPKKTYDAWKKIVDLNEGRYDIGTVMVGNDSYERMQFFQATRKQTHTYLWPFREERRTWYDELERVLRYTNHRHHLLGISTFEEIVSWESIPKLFSYDTCKPFKWAYEGKVFHEGMALRGVGRARWNQKMTTDERMYSLYNIAFMRRFA